jgi:tetratricopeptide (TPR) repeat protein
VQIIEVTEFGVRSAVTRLRRDESPLEFVLYPMIHIGAAAFYADVTSRLRTADVIVAEGVRRGTVRRPSPLLSALTLTYRIVRFNRRVKLVVQDIDYESHGAPVVRPDDTGVESGGVWRRIRPRELALICFWLPIVILGRLVGSATTIWTRAVETNDLPSPEDEAVEEATPDLMRVILTDRDELLLAALRRIHDERAHERIEVAVVYGAGHMPAVVQGLGDWGYLPDEAEWLTVVDLIAAAEEDDGQDEDVAHARRARRTMARRTALPRQKRRKAGHKAVPAGPERSSADHLAAAAADVTMFRRLADKDPSAYQPKLVDALVAFSGWLADQGRPQEAIRAADEAVDLAEGLRARFGDDYSHTYAWATFVLGRQLRDVGKGEDAAVLFAEAVEIFRDLYPVGSPIRTETFAAMLVDYAGILSTLDRHEEAAESAREAIEIFRTAGADGPGDVARLWALALARRTVALSALARDDEALEAAQQSVTIARRAATRRPGDTSVLAQNLRVLAQACRRLGRADDAIQAARESVEVARSLAEAQRPEDRTSLGLELIQLARLLSWAGGRADSVLATAEAVTVWRVVARAHANHRDMLAIALGMHALDQKLTGSDDLGLAHAEEAEAIARELIATGPDRHAPLFARVLSMVCPILAADGQMDRALRGAEESVRLNRALAEHDPGNARLGTALAIYADILDTAERTDEARAARAEANLLRARQ